MGRLLDKESHSHTPNLRSKCRIIGTPKELLLCVFIPQLNDIGCFGLLYTSLRNEDASEDGSIVGMELEH